MSFRSHKFNEMVFQLLFSLDMGDSLEGDLIPFLMRELSVSRKTVRDAYLQAHRIFESRQEFDSIISTASKGYAFERIGRVERNILRFALFQTSQSFEQTISEALRLTRKFSTKEATAYVNAVLACHYRIPESMETEASNGEGSALSPPKTETAE